MQFVLTPYAQEQMPFAWWEGAFNDYELDWLQREAKNVQQKASVGNGINGVVDTKVRRSGLHWLANSNDTRWVFERLGHAVSSLNSKYFFFNLTGFGEQIQLTNYDDSDQGMYGWHIDMGPNTNSPCRKLSLVLQLSDPVEYEGGILELKIHNDEIIRMKKQRGLIIVFPSWTLHQVTPVTQGSRQSLVAWISGPSFK